MLFGSHELTCYSRTALQCASYGGFADTMSLLLEAQADPNLQDNEVHSILTCIYPVLLYSVLHTRYYIMESLVYQLYVTITGAYGNHAMR